MKNNPLVSIIIPTYNRAHLIGETLDSIIAQTYTNWECIVVDDGSTDNTAAVLEEYIKKDSRFQYYHRPKDRPKGANACRNYGFELSKGEYVNWFDSDDLMVDSFIDDKIYFKNKNKNCDFIISSGINFYENGKTELLPIKSNNTEQLNSNNFILEEVFWTTPDFFCKKESIKKGEFDDSLKSGQEYNFFVKVMALNGLKGVFLNKVLFKRRLHQNSIQSQLNRSVRMQNKYNVYAKTYFYIEKYLNNAAKKKLFNDFVFHSFETVRLGLSIDIKLSLNIFFHEKGLLKTIIYLFSLFLASTFGKGFVIMNISRN